ERSAASRASGGARTSHACVVARRRRTGRMDRHRAGTGRDRRRSRGETGERRADASLSRSLHTYAADGHVVGSTVTRRRYPTSRRTGIHAADARPGTSDARTAHGRLQDRERHKAPSSHHARNRRNHAGRTEDQEFQNQPELQGRYVHSMMRAALVFAALSVAAPVLAQAPPPANAPAQLRVVVLDETGAGIPSARITVTAPAGAPVNATADERGIAIVPSLPIGNLQLRVDAQGFATYAAPLT